MANPRWLEDWSEQEARRLQAQEWGGGSSSGTSSPERGGYHDEGQGSRSRYDRAPPRRTGRSLNDRRHDYGYDSYDSEYDSRSGSFAFSSPGNGRYSRDPSNGRRGNNRRTSLPRRRDFSDDHRDDYYVDGSDDGYSDRSRAPSSYYSSRASSPARRGNRPPTRRRQHSRSPPRDRSPSAYRFPRDADTWGRGGGPSRSNGRYGGRSPNPTSAIPESIEFQDDQPSRDPSPLRGGGFDTFGSGSRGDFGHRASSSQRPSISSSTGRQGGRTLGDSTAGPSRVNENSYGWPDVSDDDTGPASNSRAAAPTQRPPGNTGGPSGRPNLGNNAAGPTSRPQPAAPTQRPSQATGNPYGWPDVSDDEGRPTGTSQAVTARQSDNRGSSANRAGNGSAGAPASTNQAVNSGGAGGRGTSGGRPSGGRNANATGGPSRPGPVAGPAPPESPKRPFSPVFLELD